MRSFIAIPLPPDFADGVVAVQQALAPVMAGRFVPRENLHLTLAFLGDVDEGQTRAAMAAMEGAVARIGGPVTLAPESLGSFKRGRDDTFWLGLRRDPVLMELQAALGLRLHEAGIELENRSYLPHVTLARKAKMKSGELKGIVFPPAEEARELVLFRSELLHDGARYKEAFALDLPQA